MKCVSSLLCGLASLFLAAPASAAVSINGATTYIRDFSLLPSAPSRMQFNWTDDVTLPGIFLHRSNAPAGQSNLAGTLTVDDSRPWVADGTEIPTTAPNFHGFLSLGPYGNNSRALGFCPTGIDGLTNWAGGELSIIAILTNTSGRNLNLTWLDYALGAYRGNQSTEITETVTVSLKTGTAAALLAELGDSTVSSTFSQPGWSAAELVGPFLNMDITSPTGFNSEAGTVVSRGGFLLHPLHLAPGQSVAIRWGNANDGGADAQVGVHSYSAKFEEADAVTAAVVSNIVRQDHGTPREPNDDTVDFTLLVTASGAVSEGWLITTREMAGSGTYGTPALIHDVPVHLFAAHPQHQLTVSLRDNGNPAITAASQPATAPWCTLTAAIDHFAWQDGGTDFAAIDDAISFQARADGTYTGAFYTVSGDVNQTARYDGTPVTITSEPGATVDLLFTDGEDSTCTTALTVQTPALIGTCTMPGRSNSRIVSLPFLGERLWTFDKNERASTLAASTLQQDFTVISEVVDLTNHGDAELRCTLTAIAGPFTGFETPDSFAMEVIVDGGPPVSILGAHDVNGNGRLEGLFGSSELPDISQNLVSKVFDFSYVIPAAANSVQFRFTGNCNSLSETFKVTNIELRPGPRTIEAFPGNATFDNKGTVSPADDTLTVSLTVNNPSPGASPGWVSTLTAPEGPQSGTYSPATPVTFTVRADTAPREVVLRDMSDPNVATVLRISRPDTSLTGSVTAGSAVRNENGPGPEDDTVTFSAVLTVKNTGPAFTASSPLLSLPGPVTVSGAGNYPAAGGSVTLTVGNIPGTALTVPVILTDASYPGGPPAPFALNVAVPAPAQGAPFILGRHGPAGNQANLLATRVTPPRWINYPGSQETVLSTGTAALSVVESQVLDLFTSGEVNFTATLVARENSAGGNFETSDRFKAELIIDGTEVSLISQWDTGNGAPSTDGPNGPPDGWLNGYLSAAGGGFTVEEDYFANRARDEFNPAGLPAEAELNTVLPLSWTIPVSATSVQLRLTGTGVSGSEAFLIRDVLFTNAGPANPPDSDSDGIPDKYETVFGLDPHDAADKFLDADHDGQNNYQEFLARTAANDASSVLTFVSSEVNPATGAIALSWRSAVGRTYRVQSSHTLEDNDWTDVSGDIPAAESRALTSFNGTLPASVQAPLFLRVAVVP